MNLPEAYQAKMNTLLGEDYDNYILSFEHHIKQTLRANQLKTEPADLFRRFRSVRGEPGVSPVPWCRTGAYYPGEDRLSLHPYYQAGVYYLQEPSAMAPAAFLPVKPGDRVLDLCAAPGGKTTALGARLKGEGILIANDISISRCRALLKNIQMAGIPNVIVTCESPERLAEHFPAYFDKILVDAPCSGEGMFRRDPAMIKAWSPEEVDRYSRLQKEILASAALMLKPGGRILYSTCTYSPEENEQTVETLLHDRQFRLEPLPIYEGLDEGHPEWSISRDPSLACCRRFWNHRVEGEGQFAALLVKADSGTEGKNICLSAGRDEEIGISGDRKLTESEKEYSRNSKRLKGHKRDKSDIKQNSRRSRGSRSFSPAEEEDFIPEEFYAFFKHVNWISGSDFPEEAGRSQAEQCWESLKSRLHKVDDRIFLLPKERPHMQGLRVVSSGLHLGTCKKKRFEPGQALAMALKADQFDHVLSLAPEDDRLLKYLRCETIDLAGISDRVIRNGAAKVPGNIEPEGSGTRLPDGSWVLICVDEFPLGWGKVMKGQVRNKYPAAWRRQ